MIVDVAGQNVEGNSHLFDDAPARSQSIESAPERPSVNAYISVSQLRDEFSELDGKHKQ